MAERQRPSEHGRVLGAALADIADVMEDRCPLIPDRYKTCAFRHGTIPNQMAGTLAEALGCVAGTDPALFMCHHTLRDGVPTATCAGYELTRRAPKLMLADRLDIARLELGELARSEETEHSI